MELLKYTWDSNTFCLFVGAILIAWGLIFADLTEKFSIPLTIVVAGFLFLLRVFELRIEQKVSIKND